MYRILLSFYYLIMVSVPVVIAATPTILARTPVEKYIGLTLFIPVYIITLVLTCGLLSIPGKSAIRKGKIKRDLKNKDYGRRRLHAAPWTFIYYFSPVYFIILTMPFLKKILFRLFGYTGSLNFTLHPDSWVRDLPCLHVGDGSYLANKSSAATNMVLMHGMLLVDDVYIGENSCIGMGAMIAPGTKIDNSVIIDTGVLSGVKNSYKSHVRIREMTGVQHAVSLGEYTEIGSHAFLGVRCRIGPNIKIPDGAHIHTGTRLRTQQEAESYFSEETGSLTRLRSKLMADAKDLIKKEVIKEETRDVLHASLGDS